MSPFDIVKHLSDKSSLDKDEVIDNYNAYIINRALSNMMDTLLFAEEMTKYHHLDRDIQYDFYLKGIPKGKRYGKWNSKDKSDLDAINMLCTVLKVNRTVARRYLALLSEEQKEKLLNIEGGK